MTPDDINGTNVPVDEQIYEETIVEYVDNRRSRTVLAVILGLVFLLLIGVGFFIFQLTKPVNAPKQADIPKGITWIRSIYAWGNSPDKMLRAPVDTAIGPDGTVWVVNNRRYVVGYSPIGQVRHVIFPDLGMKPGQAISLEGIATGDDGTLYVADYGKNAVLVFSNTGQYLREWGIELPNEIYVRGDRVAVAAGPGVAIFDTQGKLISKWGQRGKGDADFDLPHGIFIAPNGTVYISDTQNRRIKAYDQSGRLLWIKGAKARANLISAAETATIDGVAQNMQVPAGMTMDRAGRLLVVDPFEFQILVLDPAKKGQIVARYGEFGNADGQFAYPTGISYDPARDTFAVADTANNRVQIIRLEGSGGSAGRVFSELTDRPVWLCSIPFLLLLAAIVLWVVSRRRQEEEPAEEPSGNTPEGTAAE